jgi:tRNA(fMet)-specific endonuclease VapC
VTRFVLDTNHAGLLLRDASSPLWRRLQTLNRSDCVLCRPVVAELWFMVFNSARPDANTTRLDALLSQFETIEFDAESAVEFGRLRSELRKAGKPIPMFDIMIAAIARRSSFTLVTDDAHFALVTGLMTENWVR